MLRMIALVLGVGLFVFQAPAAETPAAKESSVVLENDALKITVSISIGGRVISLFDKLHGRENREKSFRISGGINEVRYISVLNPVKDGSSPFALFRLGSTNRETGS